ncbi:TetR family transcriptional regulator [Heyndrickxia sporothermodurans]|nr:TetR family transcriptional regulator [Heyndrickxia sporothermodurans]
MSLEKNIDRRIKKSKSALKDALIILMQNKNFKDITITDIVQQADLNRGTFYKHYQYKEDLLNEMIDNVILDLIASYREPYQNTETFKVKELTSSSIKIFDHVLKHASFYSLVIKSNVISDFQLRFCTELKKLSIHDLIAHNPNPNINSELQSSYQANAILGMIIEWVNGDFKYSSKYMAEQLFLMIKSSPSNSIFKTNIH